MKQRLRPQRSVNLLHGIMKIAITSRNSVIVACTPVTVVFRSSVMSLIITFMFEPAKLQMNCARASGASSLRAERGGDAVLIAHRLPSVAGRGKGAGMSVTRRVSYLSEVAGDPFDTCQMTDRSDPP